MRYQYHIFICTNERENGDCCAKRESLQVLKDLKQVLRDRSLDQEGGIMANKSGCFGLCNQGPNVVVYPQGSWHTIANRSQVVALINSLQASLKT
jgi:(2Fe-2S) ferredoxin